MEALQGIELAEAVTALREQLQQTMDRGKDEDLRFELENITLEMSFTAGRKATAKGGVKFWVYNAEAGGELADQRVHKLTLEMKPVHRDGGDNLLSGKVFNPE